MDRVRGYLDAVTGLLGSVSQEDIRNLGNLLIEAYKDDRRVFIMGNGGSAATASHFAGDLQKGVGVTVGKRLRAMSITDHIPLMTALANDFGYADIFSGQLATWLEPGDIVIAISGSGNSPNIIKGIDFANEKGAITVGLSGYGGGKLSGIAKHNIVVYSENMQQIEDVHTVICHLLSRYVLEEITS